MKKADSEVVGGEEINNNVEMAGWGVEEAEKKNKMDASMPVPFPHSYHTD
jgi:hypothetical protein